MIRVLKIFTATLCVVHFSFNAFAGLPVVIRVENESKTKLSNIVVATENIRTNVKATTNKNGIAELTDKCVKFKNTYKNQKVSVKVCAVDNKGIYKKTCINIKDSCDRTIVMEKVPPQPGKKYPSADQVRRYAFNSNGNLNVYPVCDPSYTNYPTDVVKHCEKNFFRKTEVQLLQGEALAKLYATQKYKKDIICNTASYRPYANDDYLQCTSTDGKDVFEFCFDDLDESVTGKIQDDTANALCRLPGGIFGTSYSMDFCRKSTPAQTKQMCPEIDKNATEFGWNANYYDSFHTGSALTLNSRTMETHEVPHDEKHICLFSFNSKRSLNNLATYPGIDSTIFQKIQVKSNRDLVLLITQYVKAKTRSNFKSLKCNSGFSVFYKGGLNDNDDIVTCHLTTTDGKVHDIDFVFDDVAEKSATKVAGGLAGMKCIANDGTFDGRQCVGIGRSQCTALNYQLPGGTIFDEEMQVCKMKDAQDADNLSKFETGVKVAGTIVVGVVLTVATAGSGAPAVIALVATGVGATASTASTILNEVQDDTIRDFVAGVEQCPSAENCSGGKCTLIGCPNSECAKELLMNNYSNIKKVINKDNQVSKAALFAHDKAWVKISKTCVDDTFYDKLKASTNGLNTWIEIADWTAVASDFVNIGHITNATGRVITKLAPKAASTTSALRVGLTSPKAVQAVEALNMINDARSSVQNTYNKIPK